MGEDQRTMVRDRYARIAMENERGGSCCEPVDAGGDQMSSSACCGSVDSDIEGLERSRPHQSEDIGYSKSDLASIPVEANMGLGCGNPTALANLQPGEVVVDLGSGGGIDCFLAARRVGENGRVIGIDMTPEMIDRARKAGSGYNNVEFRLGEIEHLPVADGSVDTIISNCVINLSPDKAQVFREARRVLKKGGRLHVSDIVLLGELPEAIRADADLVAACVGGAVLKDTYLRELKESGFSKTEIAAERKYAQTDKGVRSAFVEKTNLTSEEVDNALDSIVSIDVTAIV